MKEVSLSVVEFALPAPRKGSIDALSGLGRAQALGQELHRKVQARRAKEASNYRAEVPIERGFDAGGFRFKVAGNMDGFFESDPPKIEEIKTGFNVFELYRRLRDAEDEHPYNLQLKTYGYFYFLDTGRVPDLSMHLVSTRSGDSYDLDLALNLRGYEAWLERRLEELVEEARIAERRAARRKKAAAALAFPFQRPRPGQVELIKTVEDGMREGRPLLLQAPTGLGKTVGVLFPALREALVRGQRVVYVTPKNSQHGVAEDAVERLHERLEGQGAKLRKMTVTAKNKLCLKNEPLCNPEYCEYAKGHYTKVAEAKLLPELSKKRSLTARVFQNMAKQHQVCPYELQVDAAKDADVVICDYNYVFAPRSALGTLAEGGLDQQGRPNLVIDEAHNLAARSLDYYSPSLSTAALEKFREALEPLPPRQRKSAERLVAGCIEAVASCAPPGCAGPCRIEPPARTFLDQEAKLRAFLSDYLASDVEILPKDPVLRLCFYWTEFTAALELVGEGREEFFTTFHPSPPAVKITCCDASKLLERCYEDYENVVGFSATLKPFEFYRRLMGLPETKVATAEFASPFPRPNRKLLIIPQISSKFSQRSRNYPRVAEAIAKIAAVKPGNYFAFFPSFDFLERVLERFSAPGGFKVLRQTRNMTRDSVEDVLARLAEPGSSYLLFAVQGGVFSEGVDYPGDMAIGAFVVGPALPAFDLEREGMRGYYQKRYAAGFDYAYAFPAMAKAVQAAGRVIRSETDRGLIVLMDDRFVDPGYARSMPSDWYDGSPRELVSASILDDVARFWQAGSDPKR